MHESRVASYPEDLALTRVCTKGFDKYPELATMLSLS